MYVVRDMICETKELHVFILISMLLLEGLKVAWPLSRKSNLEVEPGISNGHWKFWLTTHKL